ncbi:MAG: HD domain-containing phosphohydrolase [Desulfurivibrionaceae bacterium]
MKEGRYAEDIVFNILKISEEISQLHDIDAILDKILFEARQLARADAGSIFLTEGDSLKFSYVHNDTLFPDNENNESLYADFVLPIDDKSIVGYSALTGQTLLIDDAYAISDGVPYSFNKNFDRKSNYRTRSILTIPLKSFESRLVGVMQLINAKSDQGENIPFSRESRLYVPLFASSAAVAIERGLMTRELVLRMMMMAELRDPTETGAHVQRVGAYSAEIYHRWAVRRGLDKKEIKRNKDLIRLASMLHDVGKVGISDIILKKPGKLTEEEFDNMRCHTVFGAQLFVNTNSELDRVSRDIALNHHEKWTGGGYPGKIDNLLACTNTAGLETKRGEEIPLAARITSLADVFDALSSRRAYKEPWTDDKIFAIIQDEAGKQFDPEVVEAFMEIMPVIKAIRSKFTN